VKRAVAASLALALVVACHEEAAPVQPAARFELRAVVQPALAAAEARAPRTAPASAEPSPDTREAAEAVLGALESPDARLRGLALEDAHALGDAGVPVFAAVLADTAATPARRTGAAQALGKIATSSAVDALATCLEKEREPWLRAQCAWQLGEAGRDEIVPRLVLRLKYETDSATVVWLADALARHQNLSGLDGLRVVSSSREDPARGEAADRLATIAADRGFEDGERLYAAWWNDDPALKQPEPSDALRREGWFLVERLSEPDLRKVDDARFVLARLDRWIVELLAETLHDEGVYARVHAAQVLERRGPRARAAGSVLLAALADPRLAPGAASALGAIGDASAASALEEILVRSRDVELRVASTRALGNLRAPSSTAVLRAALDAREPIDLRQAAAGALVAAGQGDEVAPFLLECLTATAADAGAAEQALGHWIQARAQLDDASRDRHARWVELEPVPNSVPTAEDVARRRSTRAEIARAAIAARPK